MFSHAVFQFHMQKSDSNLPCLGRCEKKTHKDCSNQNTSCFYPTQKDPFDYTSSEVTIPFVLFAEVKLLLSFSLRNKIHYRGCPNRNNHERDIKHEELYIYMWYVSYILSVDVLVLYLLFNPLPVDKILDWSQLKQIADDILKCIWNEK